MHAVGFWHEHSRADRDKYIRIFWDNIDGGKSNTNYEIQEEDSMIGEYDVCSIMHYGLYGSHGKKMELKHKNTCGYSIGDAPTFTASDIWKINTFYKGECTEKKGSYRILHIYLFMLKVIINIFKIPSPSVCMKEWTSKAR